MNDPSTPNGKVVVNRAMSLDGYIAGPGDSIDWGPRTSPTRAPDSSRRSRRPPAPCSSAGEPGTSATGWRQTSQAASTTPSPDLSSS